MYDSKINNMQSKGQAALVFLSIVLSHT